MTAQQEIVAGLIDKFPKAGNLTLGRIALRDNPEFFTTINAARLAFRVARGAAGKVKRGRPGANRMEPIRAPGDAFGKIPAQRNPFKEPWKALPIGGPAKVLILQDIHIPYHERDPLITACRAGKDFGADVVILNGDTMDCHAVSKWQTDPRERDFKGEIQSVREFLAVMREEFPKARIIYKHGNHEERWESYMFAKCSELLGVEDFELRRLLRFDNYGIEEVKDKRLIKIGPLNLIHGHEYRFAISNPVNAARGLFLRAKTYASCGHFHQISSHTENTLDEKSVATWSGGCLCQLHPKYAPYNNWQHGFQLVEADSENRFEMQNRTIKSGRVL